MIISVKGDIDRLKRSLTNIQREQVPFAASMALNATAQDVMAEITRQMPNILESPTPFTLRAYRTLNRQNRANKRNLVVIIEPAPIQKEYLRYQIEGGVRMPTKAKILVPTDRAPKNRYGNLSRANRERFIQGKGKYFTAGQREKKTPGIYLRASGRIEPMAFYVDQARYKAILPVQEIAQGVVRYKFGRRFNEALQRALSTAR